MAPRKKKPSNSATNPRKQPSKKTRVVPSPARVSPALKAVQKITGKKKVELPVVGYEKPRFNQHLSRQIGARKLASVSILYRSNEYQQLPKRKKAETESHRRVVSERKTVNRKTGVTTYKRVIEHKGLKIIKRLQYVKVPAALIGNEAAFETVIKTLNAEAKKKFLSGSSTSATQQVQIFSGRVIDPYTGQISPKGVVSRAAFAESVSKFERPKKRKEAGRKPKKGEKGKPEAKRKRKTNRDLTTDIASSQNGLLNMLEKLASYGVVRATGETTRHRKRREIIAARLEKHEEEGGEE